MSKLPYLNLGCGVTFDERWTNIDFVATGPGVIAHNLLNGIPCADQSFEVSYHSHLLEHFPKDRAGMLIRECHRVLKPAGIIRIAIPDLEQIAVNYLRYLNESVANVPGAREKYEWMVIEMIDQMVRTKGGGEMLRYVTSTSEENEHFIVGRCGSEARRLFEAVRRKKEKAPAIPLSAPPPLYRRGINKMKRIIAQQLLGNEYKLLEQARFRNSGEIHQWMYDQFSLSELLKGAGFTKPAVKTAFESAIPDWSDFRLDVENGIVRKPDSLFMEAQK